MRCDKGGILTATALGLTTRYLLVLAESKNRLLGANAVIAATILSFVQKSCEKFPGQGLIRLQIAG